MKIVVFTPKKEFNSNQVERLRSMGEVVFTPSREEISLDDLKELCKGCNILAFDPDNIGGFEVSPVRLLELMKATPTLKGLVLGSTAFQYVDFEYCKKKGITVTNVPGYSAESVAEHVLAFLLGASKRIFVSDRATQRGEYKMIEGFELRGKTLGVIGLGSIGSRVAELGVAVGMNVIAYNRTPKKQKSVKMVSLDELLQKSDAISLNLSTNKDTHHILSKEKISLFKPGVIVVNTADRDLVDEKEMATVLKNGIVDTYVLEAEDMTSAPLGGIENVLFFRGFAWYTEDALLRNREMWVSNVEGVVGGEVLNEVVG